MRTSLIASLSLLALAVTPLSAQPPREKSPAPQELVNSLGGDPLGETEQAIAAANAHPLGTLANPVRVGGPEGERAYLSRLRCGDGSAPRIGPRSEAGIGAFGSLAGAYAIDCGAAAPGKVDLVFDMYHEEFAETRLPSGFGGTR